MYKYADRCRRYNPVKLSAFARNPPLVVVVQPNLEEAQAWNSY